MTGGRRVLVHGGGRLVRASLQALGLFTIGFGFFPLPLWASSALSELSAPRELVVEPPAALRIELELPASGALFCRVRQLDVDVLLRLESSAGEKLLVADSPLDRRGEELLFYPVPTQEGGHGGPPLREALLWIEPREKGAPSGRVELRCETVAADDGRWPGLLALARASATWIEPSRTSRLAAAADYGSARGLLEEAGEPGLAAQCLFARAVLLRLAEDVPAAVAEAEAALALWRRLGDRGFEAASLNELGLLRLSQGQPPAAREHLSAAVAIASELGDVFVEAAAKANLCMLDLVRGSVRQGLACTEAALPAIEAAQAPAMELSAWVNMGRANDVLGEPQKALAAYGRAEELYLSAGDELSRARTLNNRGVLARQLGLYEQALELYSRAFSLFEKLGERRWRARTLGNLGLLFAEVGDGERARQHLERALVAWRELGDKAGESVALTQLGRHFGLAGDSLRSAEHYRLALSIDRESGSRRSQGLALAGLAGALADGGSASAALPLFKEAVELLRAEGEQNNLAFTFCKQGKAALAAGDLDQARAALEAAVQQARVSGRRSDEICAIKEEAELLARQGDLARALERLEGALALAEGLRRELVSPDLRASYSRILREAYERSVTLWMARHRQNPEAGFDARALEVSERARARTFVELLGEARADLRGSSSPEKAARLASALQRLAAKNERAFLAAGEERSRLETEMLEIEREVDRLEAEIRRENPRFAQLERPTALSAARMRELLDAETVLLVYFLGEERSFLFRVEPRGVEGFELAPRRTIEAAARRFYEELSQKAGAGTNAGAEVARLVLGPLAGKIDGRRLVVVPDGALAYLPFGALPLPLAGEAAGAGLGELLLEGRRLVHLPSVAALELLRSAAGDREPGQGIAILADPVYSPHDSRVRRSDQTETAGASEPEVATFDDRWSRLPGSRREAEMIAALMPGARVFEDFEARRDRVLGEGLAPYRIVHFATHGSIDATRPALSGLVLSMVDPAGQPINGMLRLDDIYNLRLRADLVVLSGCRTALGEEIRGEGLVGISRGFFYAGARRVLASLWPVEDFATASLMQSFYRALGAGVGPEAALQHAQLELRAQRRTRDPRSWAAFVLLGDWR